MASLLKDFLVLLIISDWTFHRLQYACISTRKLAANCDGVSTELQHVRYDEDESPGCNSIDSNQYD